MTHAKIRLAIQADAEQMLAVQRAVLQEGQFLMTTLEELDQTIAGQKEWIQAKLDNERETMLVAEVEGSIVGWLVFQSPKRKRLAHTGSFGMMIAQAYRGQGIGELLLSELLKWATENPLIEKVCLGVFSTNKAAISLYRKMGFIEEGRKINEIKLNEGEYIDDVLMYKDVK